MANKWSERKSVESAAAEICKTFLNLKPTNKIANKTANKTVAEVPRKAEAVKTCSIEGCTKTCGPKFSTCFDHKPVKKPEASIKTCSVEGCTKTCRPKFSTCFDHKPVKTCSVEGCSQPCGPKFSTCFAHKPTSKDEEIRALKQEILLLKAKIYELQNPTL